MYKRQVQEREQQTLNDILPAQQQAVKKAQQEYDDAKQQSAPLEAQKQRLDLLGEQLAEAKGKAAELNAAESGALSKVTLTESGLESSRRTLSSSKQEMCIRDSSGAASDSGSSSSGTVPATGANGVFAVSAVLFLIAAAIAVLCVTMHRRKEEENN